MAIELQTLKLFGQVAGIAGVCAGIFFYLFRDLLKKLVAPRLSSAQWFKVVLAFMTLVWSFGIFGIGAWIYTNRAEKTTPPLTREAPPGMNSVVWQRAQATFLVPRTGWTTDDKMKDQAGDIYLRSDSNRSAIINLHHMAFYGDRVGEWQKFVDSEANRLREQLGEVATKNTFVDSKKAVEFSFLLPGELGRMKRAFSTVIRINDEWYCEVNYSDDRDNPFPIGLETYRNVVNSLRFQ